MRPSKTSIMVKAIIRVRLWSRRSYGRGGGPVVVIFFSWKRRDVEVCVERGIF